MLIPLNSDRPLRGYSLVTPVLIGVNLAVYALEQTFIAQQGADAWDETRASLVLWRHDFHWWQLFTYAFLHGGWMHLLGNMLFLWTFGRNIEDKLGKIGFLLFYLAGGAAAGGLHILYSRNPVVGASGAIAACAGAYLVLFPRTHIRCLFLIFFSIVTIPAWWFIGGSIAWDLFGGGATGGRIAHLAHLGGDAFGIIVAMGLRGLKIIGPEEWDLVMEIRQARRRAEIKAAVTHAEQERTRRISTETPVDPQTQALTEARARIGPMLAADKFQEAAEAYAALLAAHPAAGRLLAIGRRPQLDIANQLFTMGRHGAAADAYQVFIDAYAGDPEEATARVMLALLSIRYLRDAARGERALAGTAAKLRDPQHKDLAAQLERELSAMPRPAQSATP